LRTPIVWKLRLASLVVGILSVLALLIIGRPHDSTKFVRIAEESTNPPVAQQRRDATKSATSDTGKVKICALITGDESIRPVSDQTRDAVVQLAVGAQDPAVYAMAVNNAAQVQRRRQRVPANRYR